MKQNLLLLALACITYCFSQNDTLNNSVIIKLVTAKLGEKLIINKIKTSPVHFDISADGLIQLKKNGVSDSIVSYMVVKQSQIDDFQKENQLNNSTDSEFTIQKSGIYFGSDGQKFTKLDPTMLTTSYEMGFYTPGKYVLSLDGSFANYTITKTSLIYFNFIPSKKDLNSTNNSGSTNSDYMDAIINQMVGGNVAISPNEFKLVKLKVKKNKRKFYQNSNRIMQPGTIKGKFIVNFKYEKVSEYTYKITLPSDLEPGQYCFVYLSGSKAFDFTIE